MDSTRIEQQWLDQGFWSNAGLDRLAREVAHRLPDCVALIDQCADNKQERLLTFAELDVAVERVAEILYGMELPKESFVAVSMSNRIEAIIALLACWRSGHGFVYLPCDWSLAEASLAFEGHDVSAFLFHSEDDSEATVRAYHLVESVHTIRQVFCFGAPSDGIIGLGVIDELKQAAPPMTKAKKSIGKAVAQLGWAVGAEGWSPYLRYHNHLRAQGLAVTKAIGLKRGSRIMTLMHPLGVSGLASATIPWLLTAGTLRLVSDVTPAAFRRGANVSDFVIAPSAFFNKVAITSVLTEASVRLTLGRVIAPAGVCEPLDERIGNRVVDLHLANQYLVIPLVHVQEKAPPRLSLSHMSPGFAEVGLLGLHSRVVDHKTHKLTLFASGAAVPIAHKTSQEEENREAFLLSLGYYVNFVRNKHNMVAECIPAYDQVVRGGQIISLAALDACVDDHSSFVEAGFFVDNEALGTLGLALVPNASSEPMTQKTVCEALLRSLALSESKLPHYIFMTDSLPRHLDGSLDRDALRDRAHEARGASKVVEFDAALLR